MAIALDEWTRLIEEEYLSEFIAEGGAAVKLVVAADIYGVTRTLALIGAAADRRGYLVAWIDSSEVRVQMIDQIFFAVARQVDWNGLAERWLRDRFAENGYTVAPEQPLSDLDSIAAENNTSRQQILSETRRWTQAGLMQDERLAHELRTAFAMLCLGQINPQNVAPTDAAVVQAWLRGERTSLSVLKRLQIYQKIGRHNARLMLASLAALLPRVGMKGIALLMDIRAVVSDAPPSSEPGVIAVRYTRGAVQDAYEVLRQFIDDTDEMEHLLLVAAAGPGLIDNERRGIDSYAALKMRTSDEVRDRNRANPLGTLVRLDTADTASEADSD